MLMTTEAPDYIATLGYIRHLVERPTIDVQEVDQQFKIAFDELCEYGSIKFDAEANHNLIMVLKRIAERLNHPMINHIIHFWLTGSTRIDEFGEEFI
jgi:hypothetical protein